ncbi:MAG: hypothetical protein J5706_04430 [Elusimicrobiales bacterium]|nr:hypothetical protein [Elusimicrobiales bacterium]
MPCGFGLIPLMILFMIGFIVWQFKLMKKYALSYDRFKIDAAAGYVSVNGRRLYFNGIDYISVRELQQPSDMERMLSKSACYSYMAEIVFHLKGGEPVCCAFNAKGALYKALKDLQPFIRIDENIDNYKPHINWAHLIIIIAAIIIGLMAGKH